MSAAENQANQLDVEIFAFNEQAWINGEIRDILEINGQRHFLVRLSHHQL